MADESESDDELDALLGPIVRLAVAHGAVNDAIAVVISMLAALLGLERGDVRAPFGAGIRHQVRVALAAPPAAHPGLGEVDFALLAHAAVLGGACTPDAAVARVTDALRHLPDASATALNGNATDAMAAAAATRALADAGRDRAPGT